jgi:hypothetical protein
MPKVFAVMGQAQTTKIPPNPPLKRGVTTRNCFESPPLEKGDLGGFKKINKWNAFLANAINKE